MDSLTTDMRRGVYRRLYSAATTGRRINSASLAAEFWFWRLHMICDDFGTFVADADLCRLAAAPRRKITDRQVGLWLSELAQVGLIVLYKVNGDKFGQIKGFCDFQPAGKNGKRIQRFPVPSDGIKVNPGVSSGILGNPGEVQPSSASESDTDTDTDTESDTDISPPSGGGKQAGAKRPKEPKPRQPDPIWDAVCAEFGLNPVTKSERSRVGGIVRDLKLKGAAAADIGERLARYRAAWPKAAATPEALLKHWDTFGGTAPASEPTQFTPPSLTREEIARAMAQS